MEGVELSSTLEFNGTRHLVSVKGVADSLEVELEEPSAVQFWRGRFAASYIEEITSKTGNFKKFGVFVRMLVSALQQESESVFVDLLTYGDLELLKSQRTSSSGQQQQQQQQQRAAPANNKRYLILTYAAEFDRVHYPLPLQPDDNPDPQRLKAIIRQLRAQLAAGKPGSAHGRRGAAAGGAGLLPPGEVKALREQNAALKAQVRQLEAHQAQGSASLAAGVQQLTADAQETVHDLRAMRKERDALLLRAQQAEAALESERNLHRRELRRRAKEAADAEAELSAAKDQTRELRLKCRELTQELDLAQRRAKVALLSADYRGRPQTGPLPTSRGAAGSRGPTPLGSRVASPARRTSNHSRDVSPAVGRSLQRARSVDAMRPSSTSSSRPSSRPGSAGRFDPTEYVRHKRERERDAAQRLEDLRRQGRVQSPRASSLPHSRPGSMHNSRDTTPQRSRVPSRDAGVDREQRAAREASRAHPVPMRQATWERGALVRSTQRLQAAVATTQPRMSSRDQRSASPSRALQEVKAKLQSYATSKSSGALARPAAQASSSPRHIQALPRGSGHSGEHMQKQQQQQQQRLQLASVGADTYEDASAEIQDIDARLQSLQNFLKAAKAGQPARSPVAAVS